MASCMNGRRVYDYEAATVYNLRFLFFGRLVLPCSSRLVWTTLTHRFYNVLYLLLCTFLLVQFSRSPIHVKNNTLLNIMLSQDEIRFSSVHESQEAHLSRIEAKIIVIHILHIIVQACLAVLAREVEDDLAFPPVTV